MYCISIMHTKIWSCIIFAKFMHIFLSTKNLLENQASYMTSGFRIKNQEKDFLYLVIKFIVSGTIISHTRVSTVLSSHLQ